MRLERALADAGGVVAKAAETLGLSRQALYRKMEKHGLVVERRLRG
ncbi:MAG TPA: helix-turn-helix domain-containing protein [Thermoanaerobaculia bacterium]|nr:helix-turn-helix domain-containing protein [Thermoanaerobaculia bacterium]